MLPLGPRSLERPADSGFTFVGCLDSEDQPRLDGGGLLQPAGLGWSVDWWIGADDRWYLPSREASTRQRRIGAGPVIETAVRIPSGDALHRVYGINSGGVEFTVIEIENDSPVPVALALAIRPFDLDGTQRALAVRLDDTAITIDGRVAVMLPKKPNEFQAANEDLADEVKAGRALSGDTSAFGDGANAVALYPLPHKTTLRFIVPAATAPDSPAAPPLPDAAAVGRGWDAVVGAGGKIQLPDPGLGAQADAARARLLGGTLALATRVADLEPGAGRHLHALALSGAARDVAMSMATLAPRFPTKLRSSSSGDAAAVVAAIGQGAMLIDDQALLEAVLDPATQITTLVERSKDKDATRLALGGLARLAEAVGQPDAAADLWTRAGQPQYPGVPTSIDGLAKLAEAASATASWGPDEVDPAARYWIGLRGLLLQERYPRTIDLVPSFPAAWRGGNFEVIGLRTDFGALSFAIRWHGYRPALLWEIVSDQPVTLRCPGLDPEWSTTEANGETLLAGAAEELPDAPNEGASFL